MSGIGESRTELLNWLNQLLSLNYKKVEECGTGAAYCQIMDSIYQDIPMHRVKFHATAEYEMQTNYKVLQSCFTRHNIEKTVLVDKLIRCRFQDNLEFLQWLKKYWVQNRDSAADYDPVSRRKFRPAPNGSGTSSNSSLNIAKRRSIATTGTNTSSGTSRPSSIGFRKISSDQLSAVQSELSQAHGQITNLENELDTYKDAITIMERERDFYFGKLRDIEILVQSSQDLIQEGIYPADESGALEKFLNKVQQILYATEDGFENGHPADNENERVQPAQPVQPEQRLNNHSNHPMLLMDGVTPDVPTHNLITDEETF
ncbi:hypothetical protein ZYGR_0N06510 [Zygosaccharomyces rouxii]|uniref:ZYRO0D15268p n=2 Tax=Zygosaccharomyces rouxii TaxID=4956 RepID=C5DWJ1_ZYGRC|nr:uncharacterized protein ZYRO0D15268g [Zygosaccharomyces rouxii]KAH9201071.1 calponin homology domain-containing protein [Zygosaccharomyces rouxii]GAV49244.1 hypothetical protein ZYGR_0N06510 [Zygosaccharomyces rouxii]CAR28160.1 ZYRO0D15268p [Zygosaccharomyces rouxii]